MESKNLIYVNGHFYEKQSGLRLELREGSEICVVATDNGFIKAKPAGTWPLDVMGSEEKEFELKNDTEIASYKKILNKGSFLYFYISRTKPEKIKHWFKIELLEDLYMYRKKNVEEGDLYGCWCVVKENISNSLSYFEDIYARSLNELYKNTFVHFFNNKGNPACNAIDRFLEDPHNEESSLRKYRKF
jgi:hypothetical protein